MNETEIIEIARQTMMIVLQVAGPVLLAALAIGLIVALFQALTQMQEMTLVFVPKIVVVIASIMALAPYMINTLQTFMQQLADRIIGLGA